MTAAIFWSALATATLLVGMALAYRNLISDRWTGLFMAFGSGAIISAVAYQLVLGAVIEEIGQVVLVVVGMALGALTFYLADRWIDSREAAGDGTAEKGQTGGSGTSILLGSLLDGVPESLVLGLSLVHSPQVSLAFIFAVAISNIPQGLGGTAGMLKSGWSRQRVTRLWLAVCGLSIVAAALGYGIGQAVTGVTGAMVDAFAAGALLVMLTTSMIPESYEDGGKASGLMLVLGFTVASAMAMAQLVASN